ncbi:lachesin-like [Paramacrobiotus metropolitanus]|uniref:lachesin-like n=1 Tax=Paramacrobiotus metropolitanus TaxID=2943436 RepID=UPI0024464510|nr:lachesin-like [Paramacrobiotus metropolitanus]
MWIFAILIGIYGSFVTAQQNPTITFITKEIVADLGGTIDLKCAVQFAKDFPVMWMRRGYADSTDTPLSFRGSRIVPDNRYSVRYDETSMTFVLQIQDLQETDQGVYQCQIPINNVNKITAEVPVHIRRPPVISDDSTRDLIIGRGEDVGLFCNATGFPHPKISWRRQGNAALPTGGAVYHGTDLKIFDIQKEHRGTYICTADNAVGQGDRRNINIRVEFSPIVRVPRDRVGQALFYERELECIVEAFPPPQVEWVFEGRKIVSDQYYDVSTFSVVNEVTEMKLRVKNIQKKHYGIYQCVAHNKLGSATGKVDLYATQFPMDTGRKAQALGLSGNNAAPGTFLSTFPIQLTSYTILLLTLAII